MKGHTAGKGSKKALHPLCRKAFVMVEVRGVELFSRLSFVLDIIYYSPHTNISARNMSNIVQVHPHRFSG